MKVGDIIFSTKNRPNENATIIKHKIIKMEDGTIRSNYIAKYDDGQTITIYPPSLNKTIFLREPYQQMTIFDYIGEQKI